MDSWGALSVEFAASAVSARDDGSTKRPKTVLDAPVCFLVTVVCSHSCVVVLIRQDKKKHLVYKSWLPSHYVVVM